jgi:hypothetical protein
MDSPAPVASAATDAVVGVFDRSDLGRALAATHRAGFGAHARVLDGARGDLGGQLRRAGFDVRLDVDRAPSTALILVVAPGRAAAVADVLSRTGARAVHATARGAAPTAVVAAPELPMEPVGAIPEEGAAAGS